MASWARPRTAATIDRRAVGTYNSVFLILAAAVVAGIFGYTPIDGICRRMDFIFLKMGCFYVLRTFPANTGT